MSAVHFHSWYFHLLAGLCSSPISLPSPDSPFKGTVCRFANTTLKLGPSPQTQLPRPLTAAVRTAVHIEPFSTWAFKVLIWMFATGCHERWYTSVPGLYCDSYICWFSSSCINESNVWFSLIKSKLHTGALSQCMSIYLEIIGFSLLVYCFMSYFSVF